MARTIGKPNRLSFGELLRAKRVIEGRTQAWVAKRLGVDKTTVNKWEMHAHLPADTHHTTGQLNQIFQTKIFRG